MNRIPLALSALALAALAGCATEHRVASAPAPVVVNPAPQAVVVPPTAVTPPGTAVVVPQTAAPTVVVAPAPAPLRAGNGRIESIIPVPPAAVAGSTVPRADKRLTIRMDDGTVQYVDTAGGVSVGDRVTLTADGRMIHPAR